MHLPGAAEVLKLADFGLFADFSQTFNSLFPFPSNSHPCLIEIARFAKGLRKVGERFAKSLRKACEWLVYSLPIVCE